MELIIIAAISENYVIGKDNDLIWHLPKDLKRFKKTTLGYPLIMGRKTFDSMGQNPLPGRENIVVSSQDLTHPSDWVFFAKSLNEAIKKAQTFGKEKVYIIGGGQMYQSAIEIADRLDITMIHDSFFGDVFFPKINPNQWLLESEEKQEADEKHTSAFSFCSYVRI